MSRFVIEHLPRNPARYSVVPLDYVHAKAWMQNFSGASLVRTTELISAIQDGIGITLNQSDVAMALSPGDEALLVSLSFGVLLAWVQGNISPLQEDWRCSLLLVENPTASVYSSSAKAEVSTAEIGEKLA